MTSRCSIASKKGPRPRCEQRRTSVAQSPWPFFPVAFGRRNGYAPIFTHVIRSTANIRITVANATRKTGVIARFCSTGSGNSNSDRKRLFMEISKSKTSRYGSSTTSSSWSRVGNRGAATHERLVFSRVSPITSSRVPNDVLWKFESRTLHTKDL